MYSCNKPISKVKISGDSGHKNMKLEKILLKLGAC